jgi:hypothetical protein
MVKLSVTEDLIPVPCYDITTSFIEVQGPKACIDFSRNTNVWVKNQVHQTPCQLNGYTPKIHCLAQLQLTRGCCTSISHMPLSLKLLVTIYFLRAFIDQFFSIYLFIYCYSSVHSINNFSNNFWSKCYMCKVLFLLHVQIRPKDQLKVFSLHS